MDPDEFAPEYIDELECHAVRCDEPARTISRVYGEDDGAPRLIRERHGSTHANSLLCSLAEDVDSDAVNDSVDGCVAEIQ
ncbi:MAG: hypothetical protein ACI9YT_001563 [Halobacteriales archaeon]|jgi:hypothetical protein